MEPIRRSFNDWVVARQWVVLAQGRGISRLRKLVCAGVSHPDTQKVGVQNGLESHPLDPMQFHITKGVTAHPLWRSASIKYVGYVLVPLLLGALVCTMAIAYSDIRYVYLIITGNLWIQFFVHTSKGYQSADI